MWIIFIDWFFSFVLCMLYCRNSSYCVCKLFYWSFVFGRAHKKAVNMCRIGRGPAMVLFLCPYHSHFDELGWKCGSQQRSVPEMIDHIDQWNLIIEQWSRQSGCAVWSLIWTGKRRSVSHHHQSPFISQPRWRVWLRSRKTAPFWNSSWREEAPESLVHWGASQSGCDYVFWIISQPALKSVSVKWEQQPTRDRFIIIISVFWLKNDFD